MNLSESYKKRLSELAGTKILAESSVIKDELNSLPFKKDIESIGGKIYSVGGRVRDEIIGKKSKDLDILITGVPLERLEHILMNYGKVKEVGKSFGIIKFVPFGQTEDIDVAIPRTEKKKETGTGYKGFDVKSDHTLPVEVDLERRDFTMNSIAEDSEGNVIDPFGGREDLKNKIIRATSEVAFGDDPVRMLRAVQFASRFGFTIEPNTMAMIKKNASRIKEEPAERYITEFDKIIKKGNIQMGMDILFESGLFKEMFGFNYVGDNDFSKIKTMSDLLYKLVEGSGNLASSFIKKNLTNTAAVVEPIKGLELQEHLTGDKLEDRRIVQRILNTAPGIEHSGLLKNDTKAIMETFINGKYPLKVTDLKINGDDLKAMGFQKEQIGKNQALIMQAVLSDELSNKKEDIIKFLEDTHKSENPEEKKDEPPQDNSPDSINSINETRKVVRKILFESLLNKSEDYKKWKRKNVTLRGIANNPGEYNGVGSITLGDGFYTAHLGNKDMARKYGTVYYVVNGRPKHPLVFNNTNESEIWLQRNLYFKNFKDMRDFNKHTTIEDEVQKMGYDGIEIKGREMVNFKPENIQYFKTEKELIDYYENQFKNNVDFVKENLSDSKKKIICPNIKLTDEIISEVNKFESAEQLLRAGGLSIELLDRAAFGFSDQDIKTMMPKQLKIRWFDDLKNVKWEIQKSGLTPKKWAEKINLSEPVDVEFIDAGINHDGAKLKRGFYIWDGHHRYYAAKILGKPLNVNLEIKINPTVELAPDLSYDDFHRCVFEQAKNTLNENKGEIKGLNKYVYHTSNIINRKRIEKNGIVPFRGVQWLGDTPIKGKAVFATNSDNAKDWFDSTYDDDVWRIDTTKIQNVKWFTDPNFDKKYKHIYTKDSIPKNAIELVKMGTGKDLL